VGRGMCEGLVMEWRRLEAVMMGWSFVGCEAARAGKGDGGGSGLRRWGEWLWSGSGSVADVVRHAALRLVEVRGVSLSSLLPLPLTIGLFIDAMEI